MFSSQLVPSCGPLNDWNTGAHRLDRQPLAGKARAREEEIHAEQQIDAISALRVGVVGGGQRGVEPRVRAADIAPQLTVEAERRACPFAPAPRDPGRDIDTISQFVVESIDASSHRANALRAPGPQIVLPAIGEAGQQIVCAGARADRIGEIRQHRRGNVGLRIEEPDREVHAQVQVYLLPVATQEHVHRRKRDIAGVGERGAEVPASGQVVVQRCVLERQLAKEREIIGESVLHDEQVPLDVHVGRHERECRRDRAVADAVRADKVAVERLIVEAVREQELPVAQRGILRHAHRRESIGPPQVDRLIERHVPVPDRLRVDHRSAILARCVGLNDSGRRSRQRVVEHHRRRPGWRRLGVAAPSCRRWFGGRHRQTCCGSRLPV